MGDHETVGGVLDAMGLANHLIGPGDMGCPSKPMLLKAYCGSRQCARGRRHGKLKCTLRRDVNGVNANVGPYSTKPAACPDCGGVLTWRREIRG